MRLCSADGLCLTGSSSILRFLSVCRNRPRHIHSLQLHKRESHSNASVSVIPVRPAIKKYCILCHSQLRSVTSPRWSVPVEHANALSSHLLHALVILRAEPSCSKRSPFRLLPRATGTDATQDVA